MNTLAWTPPRWRESWRLPFAAVLALVVLVLLRYRETALAMVEIWIRSETFTHAFVVPPIVAWLIWRQRDTLARLQPVPTPWVLPLMVGLGALWWVGSLVEAGAAMQLALTGMIVAAVPLVLGPQVARALAFPLAFTFFAVPFGDFLTPTLMHWTAEVLVAALRLTGIPVYQEGQQLVIPTGRWAVVEACSGIRYLMATVMVGSLFAYLNYVSLRRRLVFVAVAIVLPVLANWARAYIIVMLGHLSGNRIAAGADHLIYGWVFFGVVILALFFVGARWAEHPVAAPATGPAAEASRADRPPRATAWRWAAVAGAGMLAALWPSWLPDGPARDVAPGRLALPDTLGEWRASAASADDWAPAFRPASARQARVYQGPRGTVTVHVGYYLGREGEGRLVSSANRLLEGKEQRWHVLATGRTETTAPAGQPITWRTAVLLGDESAVRSGTERPRLTVWQVYWIGGRLFSGDAEAKLHQAWLAMRGQRSDGAVVHLVSTQPDAAAAHSELTAFVAENFDMLQRSLTLARESR